MNIGQQALIANTQTTDLDIAELFEYIAEANELSQQAMRLDMLSTNISGIKTTVENTTALEGLTALLEGSFEGMVDFSSKESIVAGLEAMDEKTKKKNHLVAAGLVKATVLELDNLLNIYEKAMKASFDKFEANKDKIPSSAPSDIKGVEYDSPELRKLFPLMAEYEEALYDLIWNGKYTFATRSFGFITDAVKSASTSKIVKKIMQEAKTETNMVHKGESKEKVISLARSSFSDVKKFIAASKSEFIRYRKPITSTIPEKPEDYASYLAYVREWRTNTKFAMVTVKQGIVNIRNAVNKVLS